MTKMKHPGPNGPNGPNSPNGPDVPKKRITHGAMSSHFSAAAASS